MPQAISRRPEFYSGSIHVGFVVDKAAMKQVLLRVLPLSPVGIISRILHTNLLICHRRYSNGERRYIIR